MTEKLCVFISYKRQDQPFAERLWEALRAWGCDTWLDVKNIPSGISEESSGWIDAIHKGLKRSHVLIGVVSPESLQSERVKEEWYWAKLRNRRILLLRLRPFDLEEMPPPFATANYIDLVEDERRGFEQLRIVLQEVHHERDEFKAEITPPALSTVTEQPKAIPAYLLERPAHQRYVPWRITLRAVGLLALPVSFLWLLTQPDFEPLLALLGAIGSILASFVGSDSEGTDLNLSGKLTEIEQMRKRVYQFWVQGVMQTALKEVESVGIALDMQPEAVVRDTRKNVGDIALPNDSRHVRQVYDIFKSFLILGDPGAGKTIMLLQLAESLILDPPPTHSRAIPLVLNLSSWALHPRPLHEWLEEEVWRTYRVRGNRVKGWLQKKQLLLLLDGLDEVKEELRAACVEAINTFRKEYAYVPLVVCSRIKDYERLGETKLELPGAILLEALSQAQIDHYLSDPGLAHLKRVIAGDAVLRDMATTPFLLNTMIYAYRHELEDAIRGFESEAQRREHLFNTYVERRLDDEGIPYDYQPSIAYLEWLATKMQAYVQTVFHLEDIQPEWVADDPLYQKIINGFRVAYALILTLVYALTGWQMGAWIGLLVWGAGGALVGAVIAVRWGNVLYEKKLRTAVLALLRALLVSVLIGFGSAELGGWIAIAGFRNPEFAVIPTGIAVALTCFGFLNNPTVIYRAILWLLLYQRKRLPVRTSHFLDALAERQILRRMGGGYIFIHRYLLENFARVDEVFILIDQLLADDEKADDKAAAALINVGQPALRPLRESLEQRTLSPAQKNRLYYPLDVLQPRPGVGLRADGLPDIEWCDIPAGKFLMGSDKAKDPKAQDDELPQQEVTLPAYKIAKYPVTNAQFAAFVSAPDGYNNPAWWTEAGLEWKADRTAPDEYRDPDFRLLNHPRIYVRWFEAVAFCRWLSAKLGVEVRLPTEAEWEKAARGADGRIYPYGDTFDAAKGNTSETGIGKTSAVGIFPDGASPYDALDMSGNVWEWCATKWRESYAEPADDDLNGTDVRVLRGGSWLPIPRDARAAYRNWLNPNDGYLDGGFRVVCGSVPI